MPGLLEELSEVSTEKKETLNITKGFPEPVEIYEDSGRETSAIQYGIMTSSISMLIVSELKLFQSVYSEGSLYRTDISVRSWPDSLS